MTTCADCGVAIVEFPAGSNRWAHLAETLVTSELTVDKDIGSDRRETKRTYEFCCRVTYDTSAGEGRFRVLSADYHHPIDREQRHFTAPVTP